MKNALMLFAAFSLAAVFCLSGCKCKNGKSTVSVDAAPQCSATCCLTK